MEYIYKDDFEEIKKDFESLGEGYIERIQLMYSILKESDWALVIKCHAILESVVTELLLAHTDQSSLRDLIERLPLSDEEIGKMKIAKDYDCIPRSQRSFVRSFSTLRNNLVHKVGNINFNFEDHVSTLNKEQKKNWSRSYSWWADDDDGEENVWGQDSLKHPKIAVWLSVFFFMVTHSTDTLGTKTKNKMQKAMNRRARDLVESGI